MTKIGQNRGIFENLPDNPLFMQALSPFFKGTVPSCQMSPLVKLEFKLQVTGYRLQVTGYRFQNSLYLLSDIRKKISSNPKTKTKRIIFGK